VAEPFYLGKAALYRVHRKCYKPFMARQDSKILRAKYTANRISGMLPTTAAKYAGYKNPNSAVTQLKRDTNVERDVMEKIEEISREAYYTRDRVLEVTEEAINVARVGGDAGSMIRGVQEINKMQGFYAPEAKIVVLDHRHEVRQNQIQEMPEEELLKRLGKQPAFIDAEFEEVPES
jgi:hypothetical protein